VAAPAQAGQPAVNAAKPKKHTAKQAEKVVKTEIGARYLAYDPKYGDDPVTSMATCKPLTSTLFKCTWLAESKTTVTTGKAKVKFYSKGSEATFSDVSCGMNYDNPNEIEAEIGADTLCDEDPHNG